MWTVRDIVHARRRKESKRKSVLDLLVHSYLFTNPTGNGELLSPGNTLGTQIQLHRQKSNANSQSWFSKNIMILENKKTLMPSFSQKVVLKTVFPRTSAEVSLQIFHRVYRTHVKPGYRMNNKKQSMIRGHWTRESQIYCLMASASVLFLITYKALRCNVWVYKRRKDVFAVKPRVKFQHEPVWTNGSSGCALTLISMEV